MIFIALAAEGIYLVMKASLFIPFDLVFGLSSKGPSLNLTVLVNLLIKDGEYSLLSKLLLCFALKA